MHEKRSFIVAVNSQFQNHPLVQKFDHVKDFSSSQGKWGTDNIGQMCPMIKQWKLFTISIFKNFHSVILKQISEIQFSQLQNLNVSFNNIHSIEGLSRIYTPLLINLNISNNEIQNAEDLSKTYWKDLYELDISSNYLVEAKYLSKMLICQKIQFQIKADFNNKLAKRRQDTRWAMKLENENIELIIRNRSMKKFKNIRQLSKVGWMIFEIPK